MSALRRMRRLPAPAALVALATLCAAGCQRAAAPAPVDVIAPAPNTAQGLVNANILTMDPAQPHAQAIAWRDGRIIAVGTRAEVEAAAGAGAQFTDLGGLTVTPGFIETHSHTMDYGSTLAYLQVYPWDVPDIATLLQMIRDAKPGPDGWITAFGFDINLYRDGRAIALAELDAARSDVPVFISDQSGHAASVNSLALEKAGLGARTPNPAGGEYVRDANGRLTGRLLGHAAMFSVYPPPTPSPESALRGALEHARAGITTSTEGGIINPAAPAVLLEASAKPGWPLRIVAGFAYMVPAVRALVPERARFENAMVRYAFVKLWNDGSSQAGTALLSEGYADFPGADPHAPIAPDELKQQVTWIIEAGLDPHIHSNGDQSTDALLDAVEHAVKATGRSDVRPVIIHGQFIRPDQFERIERMRKELGVTIGISFMTVHLDFWGDIHQVNTYGPVRAQRITAVRDAIAHGIPYALHNDPPVTPPRPMHAMWTAMVRRAPNGTVLGPDQRLTAEEALAGYTRSAAWLLRMEQDAGTLETGKLADLTLLDADPLAVDAEDVRNIGVVGTFVGGKRTTP